MLPVLPLHVLLRCCLAMGLFLIGWGGCTCWALRALKWRSPDLSIAAGFALWVTVIVTIALALPVMGLFHPVLFVLLPLLVASTGFIWVRQIPWKQWTKKILNHGNKEALFSFGLLVIVGTISAVTYILLSYPVAFWDTVSYHQPISILYLQEGRFWDLPSLYIHVNSYPKNGEILAAWLLPVSRWLTMLNLMVLPTWIAAIGAGTYIFRRLGIPPGAAFFLMALSAASPPIMLALTRDAGNVDLLQGVLLLTGLALSLDIWLTKSSPSIPVLALALLAICLCPGVKASGFILGGLLGFCLIAILVYKRVGWKMITGTITAALILILLLSSYWLVFNYQKHGNPTHPISCTVMGITLFQGELSLEEFIGGAERLNGRTGLRAFLRSVRDTNFHATVGGERLGGWGWHIRYLALPIWPLAFVVTLWRRRWLLAAMMIIASLLLLLTPGYWWSRFGIVFTFLLPLSIAAFWKCHPKDQGSWWNNLILAVWSFLALGTGGICAMILQSFPYNNHVLEVAAENNRPYAIQQDNLSLIIPKRHKLYHWVSENITPNSVLIYDIGEPGDHFSLLFRPEVDHLVRNQPWPSTPEPDADFLLLSHRKLRNYLGFSAGNTPPQQIQWSDKSWHRVYDDKWYIIFEHLKEE